jgi:hypothetical protein
MQYLAFTISVVVMEHQKMIQTHTQVLGILGLYKRKHTIFEGWKEIWKLNKEIIFDAEPCCC